MSLQAPHKDLIYVMHLREKSYGLAELGLGERTRVMGVRVAGDQLILQLGEVESADEAGRAGVSFVDKWFGAVEGNIDVSDERLAAIQAKHLR